MSPRFAPELVSSDFVQTRGGDECECFGIAEAGGEIPLFVADGAVAPRRFQMGVIGALQNTDEDIRDDSWEEKPGKPGEL